MSMQNHDENKLSEGSFNRVINLLTEARDVLGETVATLKKENEQLKEKLRVGTTTAGIEAIRRERIRQIEVEGWTSEYADQWRDGELASAAVIYAIPQKKYEDCGGINFFAKLWPFDISLYKLAPFLSLDNRKRDLEKAGALIAAEWERLDRIEKAGGAS